MTKLCVRRQKKKEKKKAIHEKLGVQSHIYNKTLKMVAFKGKKKKKSMYLKNMVEKNKTQASFSKKLELKRMKKL